MTRECLHPHNTHIYPKLNQSMFFRVPLFPYLPFHQLSFGVCAAVRGGYQGFHSHMLLQASVIVLGLQWGSLH